MIERVPFIPDHVFQITPRESWITREILETFGREHLKGPAFSLVNGSVIACGGVDILWEGVGEAWTLLSEDAIKKPLTLHRSVKRGLEDIIKGNCLYRVQAHVLRGNLKAMDWIGRLGFHPEGVLTAYGPGKEDYILYARLT